MTNAGKLPDIARKKTEAAHRDTTPLVMPAKVAAIIERAERDSVDIHAILEKHGYEFDADAPKPLALIDFFRVERDIARSLDELTGNLSSRRLTYRTGEFVLNEVKKATSLVEAMHSLSDYFNMMHGGTFNTIERSEKTITFVTDDADFPYVIRDNDRFVRFVGECVQIQVHCLLDSLSDGLASKALQRVGVIRPEISVDHRHLMFWPRPPQTAKPTYTLAYNLGIAQQRFEQQEGLDLSSDGILTRVIDHLAKSDEAARRRTVSEHVRELAEQGQWDQKAAAQALSISVATLRRRLNEEDQTFREIVERSRLGQAGTMLAKGRSVQEVAEALDYSDMRAFSRAFKRRNGVTPAHYSAQLRGDA